MNAINLLDTARELQDFCDARGWRSCLIGGIAVQRWGESRVTRDVDLTLLTGFGRERNFIDDLLAHYGPRIADSAQFALRSRVLLLNSSSGIGIDISLGAPDVRVRAGPRSQHMLSGRLDGYEVACVARH